MADTEEMGSSSGQAGVADRAKVAAGQVLKEDFLGSKQWKGSKLGYLTGFTPLKNAVGGVFSMGRSGISRSTGLAMSLIQDRDADLPIVEEGLNGRDRFAAASELYGKSESDLGGILVNSHRSFNLYALLTIGVVVLGLLSFRIGPLSSEPMTAASIMIRFGPLPILIPLSIRWGYLNWVVRRRSLDGLGAYLSSGNLLPATEFQDR